ncbi:diacylglycerol O-acyltransferase [Bradyrhizobium macuxiense]|uniref:diacylglycerol O-acyltransferase n=1 Tax=Bradyrhizobium macuxiense TaxID=1755647 RepID=A0A560LI25_9BRAD|nr:wax ester/triacylglycerol synthase family O-acyltransferase [Bradyrhizobium macuxiense]TWB94912.1 diacylglycerol O-acyltransferase [Bradyrhizobium macuxiense]
MDQLSSMDASFLHLETPETPMHVGSLMIFDLPEGYQGDYYEDVKEMLGKRLHLSALLNRKLAQMPFQLAEPVWIEDDDIELDYHVRTVTLRRPGTMAQLEQLVARLHASLLDRSRPLWEMYVIDGLENGQVAFYTKAHHSGVDGKAGVELAKVLYDVTPTMREVPPPRRKRAAAQYQLGVTELLQAAANNAAQQYRKLAELLPTAAKALGTAASVMASQRSQKGERSLSLGLAPKTVFNDSITNQRSYSTMTLPLADIKALGRRVGGTVNTIVMAMCSIALQRFLTERGLLPKEALIAMVPVSLRAEGDKAMNNQVSAVRVDLATDIDDLPTRFKAIHASSEAAKAVVRELKPVLGVDVPITGSPWLMTGLASLLGRSNLASRLPAAGNVLISNVPGPGQHLYMAGARMVHYFPVSIPYHGSALNITVHSYAGLLEFGLTACRRVLSQDESYEMIEHLRAALREIEALPQVEIVELKTPGADQSKVKSAAAASVTVIQPDETAPVAANDKASRAG